MVILSRFISLILALALLAAAMPSHAADASAFTPLNVTTQSAINVDHVCLIKGASTGAPDEVQSAGLPGGSGVVTTSGRYTLSNPFGANTPVIVKAELFYDGYWADPGYVFNENGSRGTKANYVQGIGIIVITGSHHIDYSKAAGSPHSASVLSARCRIHVWKIGN